MTNILEVQNVTKIFKRRGGGQVIAVDNVTFTLREGKSTMVAGSALANQRCRALSWC